jgi:hypothetical protein
MTLRNAITLFRVLCRCMTLLFYFPGGVGGASGLELGAFGAPSVERSCAYCIATWEGMRDAIYISFRPFASLPFSFLTKERTSAHHERLHGSALAPSAGGHGLFKTCATGNIRNYFLIHVC